MGAVSSILYCSKDFNTYLKNNYYCEIINQDLISGVIIDSPYYTLESAISNYLENFSSLIPDFLILKVQDYIKEKIKQLLGINIKDYKIAEFSNSIQNKIIYFIVGDRDEFLTIQEINYFITYLKKYNILEKNILKDYIHNDKRLNCHIKEIIYYITKQLKNNLINTVINTYSNSIIYFDNEDISEYKDYNKSILNLTNFNLN